MLKYSPLLLLFFGCQFDSPAPAASPPPRYFRAATEQLNSYYAFLGRKNDGRKYYIIRRVDDRISSPSRTMSNTDTLQLIGDLLLFKGDTRICMMPAMCHDIVSGTLYESQDYSVQVDALFKINQLFRKNYYKYSPAPVLRDDNTQKKACIGGDVVDRAYQAY